MSKITLISHTLCPYVQRAAIALTEKDVPFERIFVDLANKPDWFNAISPLGKVPVLLISSTQREDAIFESAAILEYLDETQGKPLHPADPLERAKHRAWMEVCSQLLNSIAQLYNAKNDISFDTARAGIDNIFSRLEAELEENEATPFFGGRAFCLVDTVFAPAFRYFDTFETEADLWFLNDKPCTSAWRKNLGKRASVISARPEDYPARLSTFLRARESKISKLMLA